MARIKTEREKKGKERKRYNKNVQRCYISHPCSESPNNAIFFKFGTVADLTYVMAYANFGQNWLKGGHFAAVQKLPFPHDFNGWPFNRQALTCCRYLHAAVQLMTTCARWHIGKFAEQEH